jgi:hypothetical protein
METYIELGALVYEHKHCKGNFARSKLTLDAIWSTHADYYDLPDDTRIDTYPNPSNQKIKALEKITIDAFEQLQQTISLILNSEGTGTHCIDQKAPLMSDKKVLSPG